MKEKVEPVYNFSNLQDYLSAVTKHFLGRSQRPYSLSQWAKKLGYSSPRIVGMVLKGQRVPSPQMAKAWSQALGHEAKQKRYFELLVQLERERKRNRPVGDLFKELETLSPQKTTKLTIDTKAFAYIADWFHLVIKQLLSVQEKNKNVEWLFTKMRRKVSRAEIKRALENLIDLKLITQDLQNGNYSVLMENLTTTSDVPSEAIRLHHNQMMLRAQEALIEQDTSSREMTSATFRFDIDRVLEAKQAMREFREEFEGRFSSKISNEVYQFNMQFFAHTDLQNKEI